MKKERYFKDELRRMFIGYAIIPAVIVTLVCGLVFMAALVYGKMSSTEEHNRYAASELEQVLDGYGAGLDVLAEQTELFDENLGAMERVGVFEDFYSISNQVGYEADMFLMDRDRHVILSNRQQIPELLNVEPGLSWGIFGAMEEKPGERAVILADAWKDQGSTIVMGKTVPGMSGTGMSGTAGSGSAGSGQIGGYLVFLIDSSQFQPVLDKSDTQTMIADRFGWVYLSNNYVFLNNSNQVKNVLRNAGSSLSYDGRLYLVSKCDTYHGLFRVYSVCDIQSLAASLTVSGILIITVLAFMTVWVLVNSKKVTDRKTRDFYKVLDVMELAGAGNLDDTIEIEGDNEFRFIADAYNEMIISLKRQMENNRRMSELVAVSQNKQLESQFNPHFLYNTLENIRYMVRMEPEIAQKMIYSLSNLLRYSMDGNKEEVTLKEDLDHLNNYLTILKYRYNRRFSYELDVEPEALECRIPKLILQPMIENSVKYGFGDQVNLKVELKAYIHDDKLIMICRDDGAGMTPGILAELTALLKQEENRSRHSGLYNIHRRIEILYGRSYGVEIRSSEGHGTTLVVTLPVVSPSGICGRMEDGRAVSGGQRAEGGGV